MKKNRMVVYIVGLILISILGSGCSKHIAATIQSAESSQISELTSVINTSTSTPDPSLTATPTPTEALAATPTSTPQPTPKPTLQPTPRPTITSPMILKIGDYVQMGKYYNEPITWRCVDIDENGFLMLSDRILTIKAFDGGGINLYLDGTTQPDNGVNSRATYGSNLWETSNLRSWLNSESSAGNVLWLDGCPPTKDKLRNNLNEYTNEKGFLATGNFTASEINGIKSVTQKSLLGAFDQAKLKEGGSAAFINLGRKPYFQMLTDVLQNYDTAYYQNVIDKVFLLDVKQENKVLSNEGILGSNYHVGKPTQKLIDNAEYKDPSFLSPDKYWYNWLRTPVADSSITSVLIQAFDGVYYDSANDFYVGVRPAFYINLIPDFFKYGNGSAKTPYILR